jgi:Ni,Fe-hydrogenase maturation factor
MASRIPVFLCGELDHSDDGAPFRAIRLLPPKVRARAHLIHPGQLDPAKMREAARSPCIIVDAVTGIEPGSIVELPLSDIVSMSRARAKRSANGSARPARQLVLDQTLALVELLRAAPPAGRFLGIGMGDSGPGETLSAAVAFGVPALAARLAAAIGELDHAEALPC